LGCCVFIFIRFYAYFDFSFDFFCDLLVIQQCVVQPPYVGIFNIFSLKKHIGENKKELAYLFQGSSKHQTILTKQFCGENE